MGFFNRGKADRPQGGQQPDLATMVLQGEDMMEQLSRAHQQWGCGSADRWGLDQSTGLITWTFADKVATAPAQILATYSQPAGTWRWSWANESILPHMSRDSRSLRDWGREHGQRTLTEPEVQADDQKADTLTAIALRVTRAAGFYRGSSGPAKTIITFGPVTITPHDGEPSTFSVDIPG
jgi:hypothetical protein